MSFIYLVQFLVFIVVTEVHHGQKQNLEMFVLGFASMNLEYALDFTLGLV